MLTEKLNIKIANKFTLACNAYLRVLRYKLLKKKLPILVVFGITNNCNLKCSYCFASLENRKTNLPTEKLLDYIDQFIDLGASQIELQGGEPTLHPDLGVFINHINQRGVACYVVTNGFMVEKHLKDLKKAYGACVSIDGLPETTDTNRGERAYINAVKALYLLYENKVNVRLHGVLTSRTTTEDIDHLVLLAKLYRTNINFVYALDTGIKHNQDARKIICYIWDLKSKGAPITSKDRAFIQALNWVLDSQHIVLQNNRFEVEAMKHFKFPQCLWGDIACFFNPDGKLYLCPRAFDREGYFVEIGKRKIKDAWEELIAKKPCYQCGQMGDLNYSFDLNWDNLKTWVKF